MTEQEEARKRGEALTKAAKEQHEREEAARDKTRDDVSTGAADNWQTKPPKA